MNEELNKALEQISDKHIDEAARPRKKFPWIRCIAAVLAVVIACGAVWAAFGDRNTTTDPIVSTTIPTYPPIPFEPGRIQSPSVVQLASMVSGPTYPQMPQYPDTTKVEPYSDEFNALRDEWSNGHAAQYNQPWGYDDSLNDFWSRSISQFLSGEGNRAYSPANVYFALSMLAETTGGNSRQQILDLLGADSIESLRTQAGHVWNAHYCDDGQTISLLANSLWLDNSYTFKDAAVQNLVNHYYASVFNGDLGSDFMNEQLRSWLNSQTGGLLQEQTENSKFSEDAVLALSSTVFFATDWSEKFSTKLTTDGIFHSTNGDVTAPFMNRTLSFCSYYWGSNFGAINLRLQKGSMWLILPDEGVTVEEVLASDEYMTMVLYSYRWENLKQTKVNLSLPKFDISSQSDLIDGMKKLGLSDIFTPGTADFTPMTEDPNLEAPCVGKIDHAVRVSIDEDGVVASAYTIVEGWDGGYPPEDEIDFVLDRPFLFLVTDDIPLFAGVVEQP